MRDECAREHPYRPERPVERAHIEVEVSLTTESQFFAGLSGDVSTGGLFVQTYEMRPVGSRVLLDISLPTDQIARRASSAGCVTRPRGRPPALASASISSRAGSGNPSRRSAWEGPPSTTSSGPTDEASEVETAFAEVGYIRVPMTPLSCPNCGAPATVVPGQPTGTCSFCKQSFQVQAPALSNT